jgi:ribonuclease HI
MMGNPRTTSRGVPQGSVLSPLLFVIYTIDIISILPPLTEMSVYADDLVVYAKGTSPEACIRKLQLANQNLSIWLQGSQLTINPEKSEFMVFSNPEQQRKPYTLRFGNSQIRRVQSHKFLGLIIDEKLTWTQHIDNLINTCNKVLNIIKATCHKWWGADPACALNLYQALIRSRLEFGSFLASAKKSTWTRIERMQARALRLILRAFPSTPIPALQVESGIPPLEVRCMYLSNKYILKKMTQIHNPLISKINLLLQHQLTPTPYLSRNNVILPVISYRELSDYQVKIREDHHLPCFNISIDIIAHIPAVTFTPINKQDYPPPDLIKQEVSRILDLLSPIEEQIYTDGSKKGDLVGSAIVNTTTKEKIGYKLPPECSIFTAEAIAITAALRQIKTSPSKNFIICSDSKSVLAALKGNLYKASTNWILLDIKTKLYKLHLKGKKVILLWIPSHCNISGNEEVDEEAKKAAEQGINLPVPIPHTDLHPILARKQLKDWEDHWNNSWEYIRNNTSLRGPNITPWYRKVVPQFPKKPFTPWYKKQYFSREYITALTRLRTGHGTYPEHLHILKIQEDNQCECGSIGTLEHIFFQCPIHEDATAQLNIALDNLDQNIEYPRSLVQLLKLNSKDVNDLLVQFLRHENILI